MYALLAVAHFRVYSAQLVLKSNTDKKPWSLIKYVWSLLFIRFDRRVSVEKSSAIIVRPTKVARCSKINIKTSVPRPRKSESVSQYTGRYVFTARQIYRCVTAHDCPCIRRLYTRRMYIYNTRETTTRYETARFHGRRQQFTHRSANAYLYRT